MSPRIRGLRAFCAWLKTRPQIADALFAVGLLAVGLPELFLEELPAGAGYDRFREPDVWNGLLVAAVTLSLTWRRRSPLQVLLFIVAGEMAMAVAGYPPSVADVAAFLVGVYSVAAHRGLAQSAVGGAVAFVYFLVYLVMVPVEASPLVVVTDCALVVGVWCAGPEPAAAAGVSGGAGGPGGAAGAGAGVDARAARIEERSRIARELHDVVAHHVSVMTVQAGAARRIIDRDAGGAREAMTTIEEVGRTALGEMRRIVGVLRTDRAPSRSAGAVAATGPERSGALLDHLRETGL